MKYISALMMVLATISNVSAMQLKTVAEAKFDFDDAGVGSGQSQTIDATTNATCDERLNYTEWELERQMEWFSRGLDVKNFDNAMKIWQNLTENNGFRGKAVVHTWELYDKAFVWPRVRRFASVQENMDMLEHFQDDLNMNIHNSQVLANFIRVAQTVRALLKERFTESFEDPADTDPYVEVKPSWVTHTVTYD